MLGLVAARPIALTALLVDAPRSLAALSHEHPDGWGIAARVDGAWTIDKSERCAAACARYAGVARAASASLVIAHVRQKTVGPTSLANTHPFRRGSFVLAHNGTLRATGAVEAQTSSRRLAEVEGETDSERLFAFVMSRVDELGDVERGVVAAVRALHRLDDVGAVSFLFSDGEELFAHRLGRTLYALERGDDGRRTRSVAIASERLTDEAWREIDQGSLVSIRSGPRPTVRAHAIG